MEGAAHWTGERGGRGGGIYGRTTFIFGSWYRAFHIDHEIHEHIYYVRDEETESILAVYAFTKTRNHAPNPVNKTPRRIRAGEGG